MKTMRTALILALLALSATVSSARTWLVAKDGIGDFTVIQDAVDAAADGDTIRIGPGRFDDFREETYTPSVTRDTCVRIADKGLALIGSGQDVTFIGTEDGSYNCSLEIPWGIYINTMSESVHLSDLTLENMGYGIVWQQHDVHLERMTFRNCCIGMVVWALQGGWIRDCRFYGGSMEGIRVMTCETQLDISRTYHDGGGFGQAISVNWSTNVNIDDCTSVNQRVGIGYSDGSTGSVRNSTVQCIWTGLYANRSVVTVENCLFRGLEYKSVSASTGSILTMTDSVIQGGTGQAVRAISGSRVSIERSHILKGEGYAVWLGAYVNPPTIELEMGGNYWGTTSADSLDAWIWDGNDDPSVHATVNYRPFSPVPISNERRSLGAVKSFFR